MEKIVGPVVWEMKKYYIESRRRETSHKQQKGRKANWIGHILRRNCLLKHVTEGKIEGRIEKTGRRGTRRRQLLNGLREKRRHCKLKEEALDRTLWRTRLEAAAGLS
jgi:hypothetical protein